ncbi:Uncharacterized protein FWK35_00013962 [Aphis craccivora]|uniref:Uncharacterized protein n=1 Tax=Aphis craccivora TaxID=307492 RepID=A0A6G0YPG8_APHCR|nr:Uncharacterized protein FWK35_00013962 [Aphis craccivora]
MTTLICSVYASKLGYKIGNIITDFYLELDSELLLLVEARPTHEELCFKFSKNIQSKKLVYKIRNYKKKYKRFVSIFQNRQEKPLKSNRKIGFFYAKPVLDKIDFFIWLDECIDFTMGCFRWQSPWCIIEVKSKHFPTIFNKIEKYKIKVTVKRELLRKTFVNQKLLLTRYLYTTTKILKIEVSIQNIGYAKNLKISTFYELGKRLSVGSIVVCPYIDTMCRLCDMVLRLRRSSLLVSYLLICTAAKISMIIYILLKFSNIDKKILIKKKAGVLNLNPMIAKRAKSILSTFQKKIANPNNCI